MQLLKTQVKCHHKSLVLCLQLLDHRQMPLEELYLFPFSNVSRILLGVTVKVFSHRKCNNKKINVKVSSALAYASGDIVSLSKVPCFFETFANVFAVLLLSLLT